MTDFEPVGVKDLILHAAGRTVLSPRSAAALQRPSVVDEVEDALEGSYVIESSGEILLVTIMPDDSGSMDMGGKKLAVIVGHNELLAAMKGSPVAGNTLFQTRYLNRTMLNPFRPLKECDDLTVSNYPCIHGTPLFAQTMVTLGAVLAKAEELHEQGAPRVRSATLIMTDAMSTEAASLDLRAEVKSIVFDMRNTGDHIVAGMGFSATNSGFEEVFKEMGIESRLIFSATSRDEILERFRMFRTEALRLTAGTER